ncbi:MAG TPA: hypothetical protein VGM10_16085 [Actinocrinis sp.]
MSISSSSRLQRRRVLRRLHDRASRRKFFLSRQMKLSVIGESIRRASGRAAVIVAASGHGDPAARQ